MAFIVSNYLSVWFLNNRKQLSGGKSAIGMKILWLSLNGAFKTIEDLISVQPLIKTQNCNQKVHIMLFIQNGFHCMGCSKRYSCFTGVCFILLFPITNQPILIDITNYATLESILQLCLIATPNWFLYY